MVRNQAYYFKPKGKDIETSKSKSHLLPIICSLNCKYSHRYVRTVKTSDVRNEINAINSVNREPSTNERNPP
jgi:hypothetical protein